MPSSLTKAHDIAVFTHRAVKERIRDDEFRKAAEESAKALEYAGDGYMVVVPQTPQEVIAEASAMGNCLRMFVERVADGVSRIVFIRREDAPDKPYVDVEVSPEGQIVQMEAANHRQPEDPHLLAFVRKWQAAKLA